MPTTSPGIEGVENVVATAEGVIAACRVAGVPVVYTRHVNRRDGVGTSLDLVLRSLGVRELFIGGFTTDCCVLTSAYDAYAFDHRASLVPDMCAASNPGSHQAAILMMANWVYGIELLTAEQLIKKVAREPYRSRTATAPDQKQFTAETLEEAYRSLL